MNHKKIELNSSSTSFLVPYLLDKTAPFVLIIPGGGYNHYGSKEQESVALKFNEAGFSCGILYYSLSPFKFPAPLLDLARAMLYIRKMEKVWKIKNSKIIVCGFSAGGHLASLLGSYWNSSLLKYFLPGEYPENPLLLKPECLCLCYPVITAEKDFCHEGSISALTENLTDSDKKIILSLCAAGNVRDVVSTEKLVSKDFPPVFLWHTLEDSAVPAENTLFFVQSLRKSGVNFEYHLFSTGSHGLSLAEETPAGNWTNLFFEWYKTLFTS